MRELAKIIIYIGLVVVVGCLLAPPLWWLGQAAIAADIAPFLARFGFSKYLNRGVLLAALAFLPVLLISLGIRRFSDLALVKNPRRYPHFLQGFLVGLVGLGTVGAVLIGTGVFRWRKHIEVSPFFGIVVGALVVGVIEEVFFRGALFGVLRRNLKPWTALLVLSVLFGCVHFIKPPKGQTTPPEVTWFSAFEMLPSLLSQWHSPVSIVGGLLTLILLGVILGYTVMRTRSLYMAIGLHAGLVIALRSFDHLTRNRQTSSIWLGADLLHGIVPLAFLLMTFAVLAFILRHEHHTAGTAALGDHRESHLPK